MKNLRTSIFMVILVAVMMMGMSINVIADETTQLSSLKVYAIDDTGAKTEVPFEFDQETLKYDITVLSNVTSIEIVGETADSTSTYVVEKDGINTVMDVGRNYTSVLVTSATGATGRYEINTTRLTPEEEETYEAPEGSEKPDAPATEGDEKVKVGKKKYSIATDFDEAKIPEGFVKDKATYNDKEYPCIKGEVKELTAFYLVGEETEGFFIYEEEEFYQMNNIKIKSRMYTVVNPTETEGFLDSYDKKKVTIIDQEVKAWVLDAEEGMYLVYAMNWNGDTGLYCYDDQEKCFQRYLTSANADSQMQAANTAYENQVKKYNKLVDKYNLIIKILCGLGIVIVILIFVIINMKINKKEKKIKSENNKSKDQPEEIEEETEEVSEDYEDEIPYDFVPAKEEKQKKKLFAGKSVARPYGDEVTFGTDKEEKEGFYGGEEEDEDDIFIDITDDDDFDIKIEDVEEEVKEVKIDDIVIEEVQIEDVKNIEPVKEVEIDDLKETLKSMLPDDSEDDFDLV